MPHYRRVRCANTRHALHLPAGIYDAHYCQQIDIGMPRCSALSRSHRDFPGGVNTPFAAFFVKISALRCEQSIDVSAILRASFTIVRINGYGRVTGVVDSVASMPRRLCARLMQPSGALSRHVSGGLPQDCRADTYRALGLLADVAQTHDTAGAPSRFPLLSRCFQPRVTIALSPRHARRLSPECQPHGPPPAPLSRRRGMS